MNGTRYPAGGGASPESSPWTALALRAYFRSVLDAIGIGISPEELEALQAEARSWLKSEPGAEMGALAGLPDAAPPAIARAVEYPLSKRLRERLEMASRDPQTPIPRHKPPPEAELKSSLRTATAKTYELTQGASRAR